MDECNSHNTYPNLNETPLNEQRQFRLNKINEIKDYFVAEMKEGELMSQRLSKYIASFDYFDKSLIFLSVATSSICNCYWSTCRNDEYKLKSCIFNYYRNCENTVKNGKK